MTYPANGTHEAGGCDLRSVIGVSVRSSWIVGRYRDDEGRTATASRVAVCSVAYDSAVTEVVRQLGEQAGVRPGGVDEVVVGVSHASLQPSRLRRRTPGGPYWRDILTTALEFQLGTRVTVHGAIELAALAERRHGVAAGSARFALILAGPQTEAGLFVDGELRASASHDVRTVTGNPGTLAGALRPHLRAMRPELVVLAGRLPGRDRAAFGAALRLAMLADGGRPPEIRPTGLSGDAVLAGAHAAARRPIPAFALR